MSSPLNPAMAAALSAESVDPTAAVFVPAIMGAGVVFSVATVLRDLVERGTSVATDRFAEVRGQLTAEQVLGPAAEAPPQDALWRRGHVALAGVAGMAFAIYLAIGATYNYLYPRSYLFGVAWLWTLSLAVVVASAVIGGIALLAATRGRFPAWGWDVLVRLPLLAPRVHSTRTDRMRWASIGAAVSLTILTILMANPVKIRPIDDALAALADEPWLSREGLVAAWAGSTSMSLVFAVLVGVATWGCARFARLFIAAVGLSIALSMAMRTLIDRPRPPYGPWSDAAMSYPSGHLTQVTVLAMLVPLAVYAMSRNHWLQRSTMAASALVVVLIAANRVAVGVHWATDVIAGVLLGLVIGLWTRAQLMEPASHRACQRCAFKPNDDLDPDAGGERA